MTNELRLLGVLVKMAKRAGRVDLAALLRASGALGEDAGDPWAPAHAEVRGSVRALSRAGYLVLSPEGEVTLTLAGLAVGAASLSAKRRVRARRSAPRAWSERARAA